METFCEDLSSLFDDAAEFRGNSKLRISALNDFSFPIETCYTPTGFKFEEHNIHNNIDQSELSPTDDTPISLPEVKLEKSEVQTQIPTKKTARRRRSRASSTPSTSSDKQEARWKSWSREEEVFLVGAVMDRFFKRGSLSSTRADDIGNDDCWSYIKVMYDRAWNSYQQRTCKPRPPDRSVNALSRHYKVMKARISQADMQGDTQEDDFRSFYDEWENVYNIDNCLLGSSRSPVGGADRRKRKVRLSFSQAAPLSGIWDGPRRSSVRSTCTVDSTSTSGSFLDEGGYAIREEISYDDEEYF